MLLLLAAVPYLASTIAYLAMYRDVLPVQHAGDAGDPIPAKYEWKLASPVVLAGLTPLALAGREDLPGGDRTALLCGTGACLLYALILMYSLNEKQYYTLYRGLAIGGRRLGWLSWRNAIRFVGVGVIALSAFLNLVVAAS